MISIMQLSGVLAALALLAVCGMEPPQGDSPLLLTERDAGRSSKLRLGGKLDVNLEGNPTTGFRWAIGGGDAAVVKPVGKPIFKPSSDALGAAGKYTFRFEAVGTGQTKLKLIYHRPFEEGVPPARIFEVTLTVK